MQPDISVVIPVFNRGELVKHTLESVRESAVGLNVEVVVVDDGSDTLLEEDLQRLGIKVDRLIRQENQGLLFARLTGMKAATGRLLLFLDSDDLISKDKLRLHVEAMRGGDYDVTYSDHASLAINSRGEPVGEIKPDASLASYDCPKNRFPELGLPPHNPVFDADYLGTCLETPSFPPSPLFNPVAEIWFYHHCYVHPTRTKHIPGPHTIVCHHDEGRITDHWEVLGVASLCVIERFIADPPQGAYQKEAIARVGANALNSWRRHPLGMPDDLENRYLAIWKKAGNSDMVPVGTKTFGYLCKIIGTIPASWILRRLRNKRYNEIKTVSSKRLRELIDSHPPPAHA